MKLGRALKTFGIFVEVRARRYPIFVFQCAVVVIHRDFTHFAAALLLGAWLGSRVFHHILVSQIDYETNFKLVRFLKTFSHCRFTPIPLKTTVGSDTAAALVGRAMPLTPAKRVWESRLRALMRLPDLETFAMQNIRLFHVARGSSASKPCPIAFTTRAGGYVFLPEKPASLGAVQRFFLLHELGHLSLLSKYTWLRATFGCAPFGPVALWALPQLSAGVLATVLIIAYWLVFAVLRDFFWSLVRGAGRALDEMEADRFALTHLTPAERMEVAEFFREYPVADDEMLPPEGNLKRRQLMEDNLEHIRKFNGEPDGFFGFPQSGKTEWPVLLNFAALLVLAGFASPATFVGVWVLAFLAVTTIPALVVSVVSNRALREVLDQALPAQAAVPADCVTAWPEEPRWIVRLRGEFGLAPVLPKHAPAWMRGSVATTSV